MTVCTVCGASNPETARFCDQCGNPLTRACPRCGAPLARGARFCPSCGQVVQPPAATQEERKVVTVLFADVVGSTDLGERLDPEQVKEVMGAYFGAMREEIEAEGGTVEKFIGDAVMAVFGVPLVREDDRARALRAALRMRRRLALLNETTPPRRDIALRMRVGINTGEVVVTPDPRPGEGMVAGDAVNAAARLEQAAEPGQIVVSGRTARAVAGFVFRTLGLLTLRGKGQSVEAFEVIEERAGEQRGVPGLRAPMVGRDRELTLLCTLHDRVAAERRPHLVTLYGEAGVGKSRLLVEFLNTIEPDSALVLRGRCLPHGDGVTYWPLAEILKGYADVCDGDASAEALRKITASVAELAARAQLAGSERVAAALAYTVGLEHPEQSFDDLPARQVSSEIHRAWRAWLSAVTADRPAIVVVEDIHWADAALLELLRYVADHAQGGALIVCPSRPELSARYPSWGGGSRSMSSILIEPLDRDDSERLMTSLLATADIPERLRSRILGRAEGNPFFLEEILRSLIDSGKLVRSDGRWHAVTDIDECEIPDTVQEVLAARIDLLPAADKRFLQLAAVVGRIFWKTPVQQLLDGEASQLDEVLDRLQDRELVSARMGSTLSGESEFGFKHVLTRDVAYASLPRRERGQAHAAVARWMERTTGERGLEMVELLAYHYREAYHAVRERDGDSAEALREKTHAYLLAASDDARSKLASSRATRLAEQALELAASDAERAAALEALGHVAEDIADGDEAWRCYREAADARLRQGTSSAADRAALALTCASACEIPSRWPGSMRLVPDDAEIRRYLDIGLEADVAADSAARVRLLTAKGFWPWGHHDTVSVQAVEEAVRAAEDATDMALRLDKPNLASAALDALASTHIRSMRVHEQLAVIDRRLALVERISNAAELGDIYAMAAWVNTDMGRYRTAATLAATGYELTKEYQPRTTVHCLAWQALALYRLGAWDTFFEVFEQMKRLLGERVDDPQYFAMQPFAAAIIIHDARAQPEPANRIASVLERVRNRNDQRRRAFHLLAVADARRGDAAKAWEHLGGEGNYEAVLRARHLEAYADVVYTLGAWEKADEAVAHIRAISARSGLLALPAFTDRLEGGAAAAAGDLDGAEDALRRARDAFNAIEAPWEAARTELALGEVLLANAARHDGRSHLQQAGQVFAGLQARRDLARVEQLLAG